MRVAFHVDQLWFAAPGGIGTYVSHLATELPAVSPDDSIVPFSASWAGRPTPEDVPATTRSVGMPIRALYPMWAWSRSHRGGYSSGKRSNARSWIVTTSAWPGRAGGIAAGFVAWMASSSPKRCGRHGLRLHAHIG